MDQIDCNLLEAWNRISRRVRRDRLEAANRARRRLTPALTRPMRPWCLCIRASDTRINDYRCAIDPSRAIQQQLEHHVVLTGSVIRDLCKPLVIPWPGIPRFKVAPRLGINTCRLNRWVKAGAFHISRYDNAGSHGKKGRPIPILYTPSPIDPNSQDGKPPDPAWGTLWQSLWQRIPQNFQQSLRRAPRWITIRGQRQQRGWDWICPGLIRAGGENLHCGRRCRKLYAPQTVWTLAQAIDDDEGLELPKDCGLAGRWFPGLSDPVLNRAIASGTAGRSFACHHCWQPRYDTCVGNQAWNLFVTQLSGGLLYGREVKRPADQPLFQRKHRFAPHHRKRPPVPCAASVRLREQVLAGLLEGLTYQRIADRLDLTFGIVNAQVSRFYREYDVHNRAELVAHLGGAGAEVRHFPSSHVSAL